MLRGQRENRVARSTIRNANATERIITTEIISYALVTGSGTRMDASSSSMEAKCARISSR
jgi:hypothetical protein